MASTKKKSKKAESPFFNGRRSRLGESRQFKLLLSEDDYDKLARLSHAMKLPASDVVRSLIRDAKTR